MPQKGSHTSCDENETEVGTPSDDTSPSFEAGEGGLSDSATAPPGPHTCSRFTERVSVI